MKTPKNTASAQLCIVPYIYISSTRHCRTQVPFAQYRSEYRIPHDIFATKEPEIFEVRNLTQSLRRAAALSWDFKDYFSFRLF